MISFKHEPHKKIEIRVNLKALAFTIYLLVFAFAVLGVVGAWR